MRVHTDLYSDAQMGENVLTAAATDETLDLQGKSHGIVLAEVNFVLPAAPVGTVLYVFTVGGIVVTGNSKGHTLAGNTARIFLCVNTSGDWASTADMAIGS